MQHGKSIYIKGLRNLFCEQKSLLFMAYPKLEKITLKTAIFRKLGYAKSFTSVNKHRENREKLL